MVLYPAFYFSCLLFFRESHGERKRSDAFATFADSISNDDDEVHITQTQRNAITAVCMAWHSVGFSSYSRATHARGSILFRGGYRRIDVGG